MEKKDQFIENLKKMETQELIKLLAQKMGYEFSKQTIISKPTENYKKEKENLYTGYLVGFDKEFETHTRQRIKETPLLMNLFQEFVQQIYKPSNLYNIARVAKAKISEELEKTLNEEQKQLLKQWEFCKDRMEDDVIEQSFIYRICNV